MKAVAVAFNQEKAQVGAFSVITSLRMELRFKLALLADEMMIFRLQTIFNVIQYSSASLNMNTFCMLLKEFLSQCKMQVLNAMLDI